MEKQQTAKPVIRFPEFTDHWNNTKLSELLKEAKKRNGDLKYSKDEVLSVSGEMGIVNQIEHLGRSYAGVSVHQYHVVEVGDIVYTKSPLKANPYGIIKQNKKKAGIVSTLYAVYNVKEENAHGEFIEHYFSLDENTNRYLRPLVKKGAKNDMKISNAYVLHDKIFVPSVPEQKKITLFLNTLDKKIDQLKQKKSLLEEYKKAIMQQIFSQKLRFKDDNGKEFSNWSKKKLSEKAKFFSGGTPLTTKKDFYIGNIPFIKSGEINKDKTEQFISEKGLQSSSAKMVEIGDLLYALYGATSGEVSISKINGAVNQAILCIRSEIFNKLYLLNYLQFHKGEIVEKYIQGGQGNLSADIVKKLLIPFPCTKEQEKIANFLSTIDDKITRTQTQIEQTQLYKKGLLQKMFV